MENSVESAIDYIAKLKFKGNWRSYQQRVLKELDYHLNDKKLNVVAAPGAGKTTLGIEVLARLKKNALILAPTIVIRNQWKQRIVEGFLPESDNYDWISLDIKAISSITVSTYQALHTLYKDDAERKNFLKSLKEHNIKTLVLDEAHHLRTEWYSTLNKLCEELDDENFTVVSLTGTPPYDVSPSEWQNYHSLCGPVDAEISIPELVKTGDLCPHQDLIYFSNLSKEEEQMIFDFVQKRDEFFRYINVDKDLQYAVESSVFLNNLEDNVEIIYEDTSFTISVISYLLSIDNLNMPARVLMEFLKLKNEQISEFNYETAQTLINGIIGQFEEYFNNTDTIKSKLKELKLLKNRKVDFSGETDFKNIFARSNNKLEAIEEITKLEYSILKKDLREVILLDYIGKGDSTGLNIYSVFDKLLTQKINLGILTGSLMVIPKTSKEILYKILDENSIQREKVLTVDFNEDYLRVESYGDTDLVAAITKLFELGYINILIGTAALLGEGWDAPCTNSLILASIVGSFMLSNQMRGRALRIDKNNPQKTANIWHLVSLSNDCEKSIDFDIIEKRFLMFEGISYNDEVIKNGIDRLNLSYNNIDKLNCNAINKQTFSYAKDREGMQCKWQQVFKKSSINEKNMSPRILEVVNTTVKIDNKQQEDWTYWQKLSNELYIKKQIEHFYLEYLTIAQVVLKTLCEIGQIKTPYNQLQVKVIKDKDNNFSITLLNAHDNERSLFIKSFYELFQFDDNTRFILRIQESYLPVPDIIGKKVEYVKTFIEIFKESQLQPTNIIGLCALSILYIVVTERILRMSLPFGIFFLILSSIMIYAGIHKQRDIENDLKELEEIGIIYTKSAKNKEEVLLAKYNTYLSAYVSKNRVWM